MHAVGVIQNTKSAWGRVYVEGYTFSSAINSIKLLRLSTVT